MVLNLEKSLQQAVIAHKEGKLQDAERHYRAILQSQPLHPHANHNLGLIAVSVDKVSAALPLFKVALQANPKLEQFWLSYIDALIKEQHFEIASKVLEQAKKQGVREEKINVLESELASIDKQAYAAPLSPSQHQLSNLLEYYKNGQLVEAETLAISITREFPKHPSGWKVLGAVLGQTGRHADALDVNQMIITLSPQDAEAHSNLGTTMQTLGRLEEAEASYANAIALKPEFAGSHYNLGVTLQELGKLDEAEVSYRRAIALQPDFREAYNNRGNALKELSKLDEAEAVYRQAIALQPDFLLAHANLGDVLFKKGQHQAGLEAQFIGEGVINFNLKSGLSIV